MAYVTGFLTPVKTEYKDRYIQAAQDSWPLFQGYGALSHVETWGTEIPDDKPASFPKALKLEPGEVVVFSWMTWRDRASAEACLRDMESDPDFADMEIPFDSKRMMWGGFEVIFDAKV